MTDKHHDHHDDTETSRPDAAPDTSRDGQTPVSDTAADRAGSEQSGTHGRPSDDSDPGHS